MVHFHGRALLLGAVKPPAQRSARPRLAAKPTQPAEQVSGGRTMADLKDGETLEMQGSGSRPYVLKNVGGVYSCTCPAWRNQSLPIERRTCKHLRKLRGDAAEEARIGNALPAKPTAAKGETTAPPLLLAESWD